MQAECDDVVACPVNLECVYRQSVYYLLDNTFRYYCPNPTQHNWTHLNPIIGFPTINCWDAGGIAISPR